MKRLKRQLAQQLWGMRKEITSLREEVVKTQEESHKLRLRLNYISADIDSNIDRLNDTLKKTSHSVGTLVECPDCGQGYWDTIIARDSSNREVSYKSFCPACGYSR